MWRISDRNQGREAQGREAMEAKTRGSFLAGSVVAAMVTSVSTAHAAEVKVMAVNAVKEAYVE